MPKILIVDDEVSIREVVRGALKLKGHQVSAAPTAAQALAMIFKDPFDLVVLDICLTDASGIEILKKIREKQKQLPVVIYSGSLTSEIEKEARAAGANEVLRKDMGVPQLVEQIGKHIKVEEVTLTTGPEAAEKSVLIVDDEPGIRRILSDFFKSKHFEVAEAENGAKAVEMARTRSFSVVLLDIDMPVMTGVEALPKLLEINPKLPVVMVTGNQEDENVKKAVESGAYGYVLKPFDFLYLELVVVSKVNAPEGT